MIRLWRFLFPSNGFSKEEMRQILAYQDRINRNGVDPTGYVVGARVGKVVEGEYVRPGIDPDSCIRYSLAEKPQFAIYPVRPAQEPCVEEDIWSTEEVA